MDTNYRSRAKIVSLYMDYISQGKWGKAEGGLYRVSKNIKANRLGEEVSVLASTPGNPNMVCKEIADLIREIIDKKKVEDANQIAFLFPSLKCVQVRRMREELEKVGLRGYAPRAGRFLEVEEARDLFGIFSHILGKPERGVYPCVRLRRLF